MFLMYCDNKGCGKENEPLLDVASDKVHCSTCGKVIEGVTSFTKVSMKSIGQVKRTIKTQTAYSVLCEGCKESNQPLLEKNKLICPSCKKSHDNMSAPYAHAMKQFLLANRRTA